MMPASGPFQGLPGRGAGGRWRARLPAALQREIILALFLILCYGFMRQVPAWNEYSRYDLVAALVDDHALSIDRYHANTGDTAFYHGHYYSDKAPGSSLLAVPTYAFMRAAATLGGIKRLDPVQVIQSCAFVVCGLPTLALVLLLPRFLRPLVGERWAFTMAVGYALGAMAFPFATMYFGHAASTCCLFAAFYLCGGRARRRQRGDRSWPAISRAGRY